jgi:hypothetical protein
MAKLPQILQNGQSEVQVMTSKLQNIQKDIKAKNYQSPPSRKNGQSSLSHCKLIREQIH